MTKPRESTKAALPGDEGQSEAHRGNGSFSRSQSALVVMQGPGPCHAVRKGREVFSASCRGSRKQLQARKVLKKGCCGAHQSILKCN